MEFTLICLNFDSLEQVEKLLNRVGSFSSLRNIIVVDNGPYGPKNDVFSQKASVAGWIYIRSGSNLGFAKGNNVGLRYAKAHLRQDSFIISNPDTLWDEDLLIKADELFCKHPSCAEIAFDVIDPYSSNTQPTADYLPKTIQEDYKDLISVFPKKRKPSPFKEVEFCDFVCGGLTFFRATDFEAIGFYDEGTFLFCEERILGERFKSINKTVLNYHGLSYQHIGGESINRSYNQNEKLQRWFESRRYYWSKYRNATQQDIELIAKLEKKSIKARKIRRILLHLKHVWKRTGK